MGAQQTGLTLEKLAQKLEALERENTERLETLERENVQRLEMLERENGRIRSENAALRNEVGKLKELPARRGEVLSQEGSETLLAEDPASESADARL